MLRFPVVDPGAVDAPALPGKIVKVLE